MTCSTVEKTEQLCDQYVDLLQRWSDVHNLTAMHSREQIQQQLIDQSLQLQPYLRGTIADIGTGAGIPGIPLAIARPDLQFTLIDSRSKKTAFIEHVVQQLRLNNVDVVNSRVEDCNLPAFDSIISRALGSFSYICNITKSLCHSSTRLLCIRGQFDQSELVNVQMKLVESIALSSDRENNLVIMQP